MIDKSIVKREGIILLVVVAIGVVSLCLAWIYSTQPLSHFASRVLSRVAALGFSCVVFVYPGYQLLNFVIWLVGWIRRR